MDSWGTDRVYPRVCGGTSEWLDIGSFLFGLSPRVRGNPAARRPGTRRPRSIPACAGEPGPRPAALSRWEVYPRVCGGTHPFRLDFWLVVGLSPRVRGNRLTRDITILEGRSIPACAGEPSPPSCPPLPCRVYPRVCGGTRRGGHFHRRGQGLSPRVRGNRDALQPAVALQGSIPACAGEPRSPGRRFPASRVYPRVCGGTRPPLYRSPSRIGLSPRVRGNPGRRRCWRRARRSIPACAGEPGMEIRRTAGAEVYPRVCGGTHRLRTVRPDGGGLSPRVRGNPALGYAPHPGHRSIPACAGEPLLPGYAIAPPEVYPRVCGGTARPAVRPGAG